MKIVVQIFFVCMLAGCGSIRVVKNKSYVFTSSSNEHVVHKLELSENRIFIYSITGSMNEVISSGNWKVEKNNLYLKSFDEYRSGYCKISYSESRNVTDGRFNVFVVDNVGIPLAEALIFYGGNSDKLRQDGVISLKSGLDTSVRINFLGIEYQASLNDLKQRQDVKIEIVPLDSKKLFLSDEVWKIRKNMVISPLNKKLMRLSTQ